MSKKYQIFVSSTFTDLVSERQVVTKSIIDLGHFPVGMESFPATDQEQFGYISRVIDGCDYYILIIGARYGSLSEDGLSFTEREYQYAVAAGVPVLAFVHSNPEDIPAKFVDLEPENRAGLERFRTNVMNGRLVQSWSNEDQLAARIVVSLMKAFNDFERVGWIRADQATSNESLVQINTLLEEKNELVGKLKVLEGQNHTQVRDAAHLSDSTSVEYEYKTGYRDANRRYIYRRDNMALAWRDLFKAGCSSAVGGLNIVAFNRQIASLIKGRRATDNSNIIIPNAETHRIRLQFEAMGLITSGIAQANDGSTQSYIYLTKRGKANLYDLVVERATETDLADKKDG